MIASASFPLDLGSWNQDEHPYYLEVFGEVEPTLDVAHAEVVPAGASDAATTSATPIYEYWWTIGHGGSKPEHRHLFAGRATHDLWHRLDDVAARVYLYFPISGGWRVQELAASAKYLSPVQRQSDWTEKAAEEWQRMQPILDGAAQAASTLGVVPGVGTIAAGAAPILSAIAKLQVGSVPQGVKGFDWYVEKVTVPAAHSHGVMQGVVWAIPKEMFELLGGRLTRSLAVSFVPTATTVQEVWRPQALALLAHAVVYADGKGSWVPAQNHFVELVLSPKTPAAWPPPRDLIDGRSTIDVAAHTPRSGRAGIAWPKDIPSPSQHQSRTASPRERKRSRARPPHTIGFVANRRQRQRHPAKGVARWTALRLRKAIVGDHPICRSRPS